MDSRFRFVEYDYLHYVLHCIVVDRQWPMKQWPVLCLMDFNHVKSTNSTRIELAIDDQQQYSAIRNASTHTRQIETDYRL